MRLNGKERKNNNVQAKISLDIEIARLNEKEKNLKRQNNKGESINESEIKKGEISQVAELKGIRMNVKDEEDAKSY